MMAWEEVCVFWRGSGVRRSQSLDLWQEALCQVHGLGIWIPGGGRGVCVLSAW